jgi:hypothetical protein
MRKGFVDVNNIMLWFGESKQLPLTFPGGGRHLQSVDMP